MPRPPLGERDIAVQILIDVTENAAYANIALRQTLARHTGLDTRARAFITELTNGVLRNIFYLDYVIDHFSKTPTRAMKPFVRTVLRAAVFQLRCMDRVPPSAAVNEAVKMTKARGFGALSGFVNGVLRAVGRESMQPILPACEENPARYIHLAYSYPLWLAEYLVGRFGVRQALFFCEESHIPPPVTVFTNLLKTNPAALKQQLETEGVKCEPGDLYPECLQLRHVTDISQLPSFKKGLFHVMDEGAMAAVKALDPKPGWNVLDLCAAPGGKTFACAVLMEDRGKVKAFDIHSHRLVLLNETAARLGITCVSAAVGDALCENPALLQWADAVLLDAPCSGLGILRKRPDIKYTRTAEDIADLTKKQYAMLETAAAYVKPGGTLVYSVCTITREEGTDQIRRFLEHHPFKAETLTVPADALQEENGVQLLPGSDNDGFFIAKLVRG